MFEFIGLGWADLKHDFMFLVKSCFGQIFLIKKENKFLSKLNSFSTLLDPFTALEEFMQGSRRIILQDSTPHHSTACYNENTNYFIIRSCLSFLQLEEVNTNFILIKLELVLPWLISEQNPMSNVIIINDWLTAHGVILSFLPTAKLPSSYVDTSPVTTMGGGYFVNTQISTFVGLQPTIYSLILLKIVWINTKTMCLNQLVQWHFSLKLTTSITSSSQLLNTCNTLLIFLIILFPMHKIPILTASIPTSQDTLYIVCIGNFGIRNYLFSRKEIKRNICSFVSWVFV